MPSFTLPKPQTKTSAILLPVAQKPRVELLPRPETTRGWTDGSRKASPQKRQRVVSDPGKTTSKRIRARKDTLIMSGAGGEVPVVDNPIEVEDFICLEASRTQEEGGDINGPSTSVNEESAIDLESLHDPQDYTTYANLVRAGGIGAVQIYADVFVVQGWDPKLASGTHTWSHLERTKIGHDVVVGCYCKRGRQDGTCVHQQFFEDYGDDEFPGDRHVLADSATSTVLFLRQFGGGENSMNFFSVGSRGETVKRRAIVIHEGDDAGGGLWKCSKDTGSICVHITDARDMLRKVFRVQSGDGEDGDPDVDDDTLEAVLAPQGRSTPRKSAISYQPILPPLWAALDMDIAHYIRPKPCRQAPVILLLDSSSSCACGPVRIFYDADRPIVKQCCVIYGLTEAFPSEIQLQSCSACSGRARRFIGPEPRDQGIFNFNNRVLFTHELLDDYTSVYTSSETPFTAWVTVVSRRYSANDSPKPFVSEQVFRAAWFAYVDLQDFSNDMQCLKCGPMPKDVIWDGVTVGFNKKHILPTLRPPTISTKNSPIRHNYYSWKQQVLVDAKLRRQLRRLVKGAGVVRLTSQNLEDSDDDGGEKRRSEAATKAEIDRITSIPEVLSGLGAVDASLEELCRKHFGLVAVSASVAPPKVYKKLFIQLAADESVLQMLNKAALDQLALFNAKPCTTTASQMTSCPVLLGVLKHHGEQYPEPVLGLCRWLLRRGLEVYDRLMKQSAPDSLDTSQIEEGDWRETGCCYSLPQIRHRPVYENLTYDVRAETSNNRGAKCSKYYAQYGAKKLTGGIMAAWCTHSVCYGFHFIPKGEGRNDVFSAMYTRWKIAPKRIVYDFACALGPYCLIREPAFFAHSTYGIDVFHASDHKKCAPAAFLETYMSVDPRVALVNSSAAECGNGGLKRIRKSVSYMAQGHAIMYTKVFLSVWNRLRIRSFNNR